MTSGLEISVFHCPEPQMCSFGGNKDKAIISIPKRLHSSSHFLELCPLLLSYLAQISFIHEQISCKHWVNLEANHVAAHCSRQAGLHGTPPGLLKVTCKF